MAPGPGCSPSFPEIAAIVVADAEQRQHRGPIDHFHRGDGLDNDVAIEHLGEIPHDRRLGIAPWRCDARSRATATSRRRSSMPHGTMSLKKSRSVVTLNANPWLVIQREMRTPIAPILSAPTHAPDSPVMRAPSRPKSRGGADHDLFEIAHVLVHVAAIRPQVQDGIADDLPGAVIGDVAAAARLVHLDLPRGEQIGRGDQVRSRRIGLDAKRDDMRVLEQEKEIGHAPGPPLFDERALHIAGSGVGNDAKPSDFQLTHLLMVAWLSVVQPGNRSRALTPPSGDASSETDPPYTSARSRTIASPRPDPGAASSALTPR